MQVITISLLGDSLFSGLRVEFTNPIWWFNPNDHHGYEDFGFVDIFDKKKHEFLVKFNQQLNQTDTLKKYFPEVFIRFNSIARPGMNLAHYNPSVNPEFVPEQFCGLEYAASQARNAQSDLSIIALAGNDTQDYNTMAVEIFLNMLNDQEFEQLINKVKEKKPNLAKDIEENTTKNEVRQSMLVSKVILSKEQNNELLNFAKKCGFSQLAVKSYIESWEEKKYWNKSDEEFMESLEKMVQSYVKEQHTEQSGTPFSAAFILPPAADGKNIPYPNFHNFGNDILRLRNIITSFAKTQNASLYDLNGLYQQLKLEGVAVHGQDNGHLSSDFYSQLGDSFPFNNIFATAVNKKLNAVLENMHSKSVISDEELSQATKELKKLACLMDPAEDSVAPYGGVLRSSPLSYNA